MSWHHLQRNLARLALVWFALALGVAVASPLVQPRSMQLVCGASGGVKLLVDTGDGLVEAGHASLDCALCLLMDAPPAVPPALRAAPQDVAPLRVAAIPAPPAVVRALAPLPARGPPLIT